MDEAVKGRLMIMIRVMSECFFWYQLTRVVRDKIHRAVKWLCVCACKQNATKYKVVILTAVGLFQRKFGLVLGFMLRVTVSIRVSVRVKIKVRVSSSILPYCQSAGPVCRSAFNPCPTINSNPSK